MSWVVANWRLKLLAFVLAIGLLMAVAFSENPVEAKTVPVGVQYEGKPDGLVLLLPQSKVNVPVIGLKDAVERLSTSAIGVTVDLAGAKPGPNQTFYGRTKVVGGGVSPQTDRIPILLTIDSYRRSLLDIEVRLPPPPTGIRVTNAVALCPGSKDPCKEPVSGPAGILDGLKAYVRYDTPITSATSFDSPSQPVQFEKTGKAVDLRSINTSPPIVIEQPTVAVHIDAAGGTFVRQVILNATTTNAPPCGYQVSIVVDPGSVNISGPIDQISRIGSFNLNPPVNLASLTTSQSFNRTIATGSDQVRADPAVARVNVNVNQAFSCGTASPSPSPSPR